MSCEISDTVKEIPLYRAVYGERIDEFDLHNNYDQYPPIDKRDVARGFPGNFMSHRLHTALERREVEFNASSGTTSERMMIMRRPCWWAAENRRTYAFDGRLAQLNTDEHRKAVLSTAICSNTVCFTTVPAFEERVVGRTLYLNIAGDPNSWTRADVERMLDELEQYRPHILDVDPLYLAILLNKKERLGIDRAIHQPQIIIFTYEVVTAWSRRYCERAFPKVSSIVFYGSTESGYNLFENPDRSGYRHVQDQCYVDFEPIERDLVALRITSWKNEYMPLVNYRIGDLARICEEQRVPTRARGGLPLQVEQLCGRLHDAVRREDGGLVTVGDIERALEHLDNDVIIYQLRFHRRQAFQFRYVTASGEQLPQRAADALCDALRSLWGGDIDMKLCHECSISPEASGKFAVTRSGAV